MIIDTSYFTRKPLFIPNSVTQPYVGFNTPNENHELKDYIDRVEYLFLVNALGNTQYLELADQFNTDGTWKDDALQKWKDLVDGVDDWKGLRFTVGNNKVSVIAYYVYAMWVYDNAFVLSSTGVQSPEAANSVKVNPVQEHVDKWNTFVEMYQGGNYRYLNWWNPIFFEWNGYPYTEANSNFNTLWWYLGENTLIYDTNHFATYQTKNTLGL